MARLAAVVLLALTTGLLGNPEPGADGQDIVASPASIHPGTCAVPIAQPTHELGDVRPPRLDEDAGDPFLPTGDLGVGVLHEDVDTHIADLLAEPHAIVVHSAADYDTAIACGDIGGAMVGDRLVIALRPVGDSGFAGIAVLTWERDRGFLIGGGGIEDGVAVSVYLFRGLDAVEA